MVCGATGCAAFEPIAMSRFSVHRNKNPRTESAIPFLLDVQSDLLDHLDTRVVIPLVKAKSFGGPPSELLKPVFTINGERHILLTPMLAGIPRKELGTEVDSLRGKSFEIIAALDVLISGV